MFILLLENNVYYNFLSAFLFCARNSSIDLLLGILYSRQHTTRKNTRWHSSNDTIEYTLITSYDYYIATDEDMN